MALRLFVALELPQEWSAALAETQATLRGRGLERLRWVRPEGIHLTIKFLGEVDEARLPDVTGGVRRAAARSSPFSLHVGGLGTFGPPARPRVLWVGVGGDLPALERLWQAVERELTAVGFPAERQRFSPHLTLARTPDGLPREAAAGIATVISRTKAPSTPPMAVTHLALMRSELGPGGARYTRLESAELPENSSPGSQEP